MRIGKRKESTLVGATAASLTSTIWADRVILQDGATYWGYLTAANGEETSFTDGEKLTPKYRGPLRFSPHAADYAGIATQQSTTNKKAHIRAIASWDQT